MGTISIFTPEAFARRKKAEEWRRERDKAEKRSLWQELNAVYRYRLALDKGNESEARIWEWLVRHSEIYLEYIREAAKKTDTAILLAKE